MGVMEVVMDARSLGGRKSVGPSCTPGIGESRPDPEVSGRPERRRFTAAYKQQILEAADRCSEPGEIGALLRKEGLYASSLCNWRRQRERVILSGFGQKRGRKAVPVNPLADRVAVLERENAKLRRELEKATLIIDVQKKVSALLGIPLAETDGDGK